MNLERLWLITLLTKKINEDIRLNIKSGIFTILIFITYRVGHEICKCHGVKRGFYFPLYFLIYSFHRFLSLVVGCSIPFSAELGRRIIFQHGFYGVFISSMATIEDDCIILHQVTIGSNISGDDSKPVGAPRICSRTFVGVGAKIIGPLVVGEQCKIGANCLIINDVPKYSKCLSPLSSCVIVSN